MSFRRLKEIRTYCLKVLHPSIYRQALARTVIALAIGLVHFKRLKLARSILCQLTALLLKYAFVASLEWTPNAFPILYYANDLPLKLDLC